MARGNRLQPIFASPKGADQELFLKTLGEACERSGFRVWAWILMKNHYHLVIETPKPNLVAGMSWFQNTYTRRFNTRHTAWGRLFGDRYKSILIDDERRGGGSSYLASLLDYGSGNQAKDHDLLHAEGIIAKAVKHFGLKKGNGKCIQKAAYGDVSVIATAWAICRNTSVPQRWIAERLSLGTRANVSERVRRFELIDTATLSKETRKWKSMNF